jgi:CRP-like cAMP-binding protein
MSHRDNHLLNRLEPAILTQLEPHFVVEKLRQGEVLAEAHRTVQKVYFPHSGIISCLVDMAGGESVQTAMIGNDGAFGGSQALDDKVSLNNVVAQVPGMASVLSSDRARTIAGVGPAFRNILLRYEQFLFSQVQQTAACNAVHQVRARACKWLLRMHHLLGAELPLTQELLAQMLGVRRTSVSEVAGELQKAGIMTYRRGHIRIENVQQVEQWACECDNEIRSHYQRIFQS